MSLVEIVLNKQACIHVAIKQQMTIHTKQRFFHLAVRPPCHTLRARMKRNANTRQYAGIHVYENHATCQYAVNTPLDFISLVLIKYAFIQLHSLFELAISGTSK